MLFYYNYYYMNNNVCNINNYYEIIIKILDEFYNMNDNINENIIGQKNKIQSFEEKINTILNKYCIEIKKNKKDNIDNIKKEQDIIYYIYQPFGSQKPPDFMIMCNNYYKIFIECKSSKTLKPTWNCSIPDIETIYLFYSSNNNKTYIFNGDVIIFPNISKQIKEFHNKLKILCNEFNNEILLNENINYYPRQMINQIIDMDKIGNRDENYEKVKNNLKNFIFY